MADKTEKTEKAADTNVVDAPVSSEVTEAPRARFDFTKLNTLAVVSLATAVTGFGAVAGVISGHIALKQIGSTKQAGRGMALAGLITGYVFVGLGFAGFIASAYLRIRGIELGGHRGGFGQMGVPQFDQDRMPDSEMRDDMGNGQMRDDMGNGHMGPGDEDPNRGPVPTPETTN